MERYGILYKITNKKNNKVYIGLTTSKRGFLGRYSAKGTGIERVYNFYIYQKKNNQFYNVHLLNSIKKYGFDAFEVDEEFEVCYSKEQLKEREKYWIAYYNSNHYDYGYNRTEGGDAFLKGEDNPRYNSITSVCEICGKPITREKSKFNRAKHHYCSPECASIGFSIYYSRENNPCYASVMVKCAGCGKEISVKPSQIHDNNYCSRECQHEHYKIIYKGSNNPNFGNKGKVTGAKNGRARKVICLTTGEIFDCIKYATDKYNIGKSGIIECCRGRQKTAGKLPDGTKLEWIYYDEKSA